MSTNCWPSQGKAPNNEWDAVWEVAARVYEECYIVEIDLDLSSLTYEQQGGETFGINFMRYSMDPYEVTAWMVDDRLGSLDSRCFSGAKKHPDFQVTSCLHNVSTTIDFAYIESE